MKKIAALALALFIAPFSVLAQQPQSSAPMIPNAVQGQGGFVIPAAANTVFAGPAMGSPAIPTFRALVAADLPFTLPLSGANGGTGIANTGLTIALSASLVTTGAGAPTLAFPGSSATYTYPTTSATLARTDAGQTFTGVQNFGAGAAATPNIAVGNVTTGLYSVSTTGLGFSVNGTAVFDYGITGSTGLSLVSASASYRISMTNAISLSGSNVVIAANANAIVAGSLFIGTSVDTVLIRANPATIQHGLVDAAAPVAQTIKVQSVVAGTSNVGGANWTLIGSLSTGSGTSGDIILQTGGTGAGAAVQNAPVTAMTVKGATQAVNFAGQIAVAAMTQSAAAQSGTICYNTSGGTITYDATLGCLTSTIDAKDDWRAFSPREALDLVTQFEAGSFFYKKGRGLPEGPQVGLNAQQIASVDDRLVGRSVDGVLRGVRYQQTSALYGPAIHAISDDLVTLRADNDTLRADFDAYRREHP